MEGYRLRGEAAPDLWKTIADQFKKRSTREANLHSAARAAMRRVGKTIHDKVNEQLNWRTQGRPKIHGVSTLEDLRSRCTLEMRAPAVGTECWIFGGHRDGFGYGKLIFRGRRNEFTHRAAWILDNGSRKIPSGKVVRHRCNVAACCNPSHLQLGTQLENIADRQRANRSAGAASHIAGRTIRSLSDLRSRCEEKRASTFVDSPCWLLGRDNRHRRLQIDGKAHGAHRWALAKSQNIEPLELCNVIVCHRCSVKNCVNPDHLYAGSAASNARDALLNGEQARGTRLSDRLTEKDVTQILEDFSKGVAARALALRYGVSTSQIYGITSGKTWQHVEGTRTKRNRNSGSRGGTPKLSAAQIRAIRMERQSGTRVAEIAEKHCVHKDTVYRAIRGETWRHVGGPTHRNTNHISGPVARAIRDAFHANTTVAALSEQHSITPRSVGNILVGKTHRAAGGPLVRGLQRKLTQSEAKRLRVQYSRSPKTNLAFWATEYGVGIGTIRSCIRGLTHRSAGGPTVTRLQKRLADEEIVQLRRRHAVEGASPQQLAKEYGVTTQFVRSLLLHKMRSSAGGMKVGHVAQSNRLSDSVVLKIRERYASGGVTISALASEYGRPVSSLSAIVRNESYRHVGGPTVASVVSRRQVLNATSARAIRERVAAGERQNRLAEEYGVTAAAISYVVQGRTHPDAGGPIRKERRRYSGG